MNRIEFGDCRETMRRWAADGVRVQTCVTSPPYFGLRDYKVDGQIGLEQTPDQYIAAMVEVFRCVQDGGWWKVLDRIREARVKETVSPLDRYFNPKDDIWKDATVENLPTRGSRGS